ncbi:MAG: hypothetical protein U0794_08060 [Isosphaeraceae bacterium]
MPHLPRIRVPHALTLLCGIAIGWLASGPRTPALLAHGGDRWDDSILTAGPLYTRYNKGTQVQVSQDALYYLDYRAGKLVATIPTYRQSIGPARILETFAERDLVADFKIALDNGPRPHFLMTTGSMAQGSSSAYGDGWAPLFVFESTSRQVAVYRIQQQSIGTSMQTRLELLEVRPFTGAPGPG